MQHCGTGENRDNAGSDRQLSELMSMLSVFFCLTSTFFREITQLVTNVCMWQQTIMQFARKDSFT